MRITLPAAGLVLLCVAAPAARAQGPAPQQGVVFLVGGIGGLDPLGLAARHALPKAGVPHELREFTWQHGKGKFFRDLQDTPYLAAKGEELAAAVRAVKEPDPSRPVYLLGHSAGAAVVLWAAGQLPPGTLERIVLFAPAVSPTFDLRPALRATKREIVSYNSELDAVILGWGTSRFGTADRVFAPAAGLAGFRPPPGLDEEGWRLYGRLVQFPWRWPMLLEGRGGFHHASGIPVFLERHVAPWLRP
jgi:predicted esterase